MPRPITLKDAAVELLGPTAISDEVTSMSDLIELLQRHFYVVHIKPGYVPCEALNIFVQDDTCLITEQPGSFGVAHYSLTLERLELHDGYPDFF